MPTQFLSRGDLYQGEFHCTLRRPGCEIDSGTHYHDFYEVQFYLNDEGLLTLDDQRYHLKYGDVAFINMFERHTLEYPENVDFERYCLPLSPSFLLETGNTTQARLQSMFRGSENSKPVYHMDSEDFSVIVNFLEAYSNCPGSSGRSMRQKGYLLLVLSSLYDHFGRDEEECRKEKDMLEILAMLIRFISEHIAEELPLERLASVVGLSTFHLCRVFKQYTGNTITQYIVKKRIDIAKNLLKGDIPISDISLMTGFRNYSYFYKAFHKMTGQSPAEYRESMAAG